MNDRPTLTKMERALYDFCLTYAEDNNGRMPSDDAMMAQFNWRDKRSPRQLLEKLKAKGYMDWTVHHYRELTT